jgi:hypothetical protein
MRNFSAQKGTAYKFGDAEHANLGSVRAESDGAMLQSAFVRTSDFETLARGPLQSFVVGRRGAEVSEIPCKARQQPTPAAFQENRSRVG